MILEYQGKKLEFYDYDETFEYFYQNQNQSFIRLGDGEFRIISGSNIYYQNTNKVLKEKMTEILDDLKESEKEHYKILIPNFPKDFLNKILFENLDLSRKYFNQKFSMLIKDQNKLKEFWKNQNVCFVGAYTLKNITDFDYSYLNSYLKKQGLRNNKRLTEKYKEESKLNNEFNNKIIEILKKLDLNQDKDISFLKSLINFDYLYHLALTLKDKNFYECIKNTAREEQLEKIFDNTKNLIKIRTSFKNSWDNYENILEECRKMPKDYKFVIACGPTGKILSYDLIKEGYIVYDLGHFYRGF